MQTTATRRGKLKWILWLAALLLLGFALYLAFVLNWSYSEGERAGYLQKFSRKGWLCKTYEGELAMTTVPGVMTVLWNFSVRDEAVARQLEAMAGRRMVLHYVEHRGIPTSCYGETSHFVDRVKEIGEVGAMPQSRGTPGRAP
jgi:hypothetical protein